MLRCIRAGNDQATPDRGSLPDGRCAHRLRRHLAQMAEKRSVQFRLQGAGGIVLNRWQRVPKRRIQVHRSRIRQQGPGAGLRHGLPQITQQQEGRLRHRQLVEIIHVPAKELLLVDRLARGTGPHFRRAVRSDDKQRHTALLGLDHRRVIIGTSRARGAEQHHRPPALFRQPQGKEGRRAFVEDRNRLEPGMAREGDRQRRGTRTGRNDRLPHAAAHQRLGEHAAPEGVRVAKVECGWIHGVSRASRMAINFSSVSANSLSGVDPATIPAPA